MNFQNILWISHSAIASYARCPHLYYLEYVYRNPKTGNRIQIISPYLSLGSAVHDCVEDVFSLPIKKRKEVSLSEKFKDVFDNYRGLKGGFLSTKKEDSFFQRGVEMIKRVEKSSCLLKPTIKMSSNFPTFNLIGEEVKLVGNIDWIEKLPGGDAHIVDFKTGKNREKNGSLQLPIYTILAKNNLKEKVKKVSYWYLQHDDNPVEQEVGDIEHHTDILREKARTIKKAIKDNHFPCNFSGKCFSCGDYEKIFKGEVEKIESGKGQKKDIFCVFKEKDVVEKVLEEDFLDEREKTIFEMRTKHPMEKINKDLRLSEEKSNKIVAEIKEKLNKNLRKKELKIIIKLLQR